MKIVFDLHTHTLFSAHAYSTAYENIMCAKENGLSGIAVTDHGCAMVDAGHPWHFNNIGAIGRTVNGITVLRGIEANILNENGDLDFDADEWSENLEVVIASVHSPIYEAHDENEQLSTMLKVAENPYVNIMGHPERCRYEYDFEPVVKKAMEYEKIVEINQHSLEMGGFYTKRCTELAKICKKLGAAIAVDTDAHFCTNIGRLDTALKMLEEIGFDEKLVINADYEKTIEKFCK